MVDYFQEASDDSSDSSLPRFVITEFEDVAIRFLYLAGDGIGSPSSPPVGAAAMANDDDDDKGGMVEYTLSCCREEYPCNTIVTCSLEPNHMKIVDYDLLWVVKELRHLALSTAAPPLPSMLGVEMGRRRSAADLPSTSGDEELFSRKKKRSSSHPEKLSGKSGSIERNLTL